MRLESRDAAWVPLIRMSVDSVGMSGRPSKMLRRIGWLLFGAVALCLADVIPAFAAGGVIWGT